MRRFAVQTIPAAGEQTTLPEDAAHHFRDVLRGRLEDTVELFDGNGTRAIATVTAITAQSVHARIDSVHVEHTDHHRILVVAVLKGPAMDTAVRMATEAGATAIWPVLSSRTIATGDRSDRWNRIAQTAAQQCGRATVPEVLPPQPYAAAVSQLSDLTVFMAHPAVEGAPAARGDCAILIGPEGGWTDAEVTLAVRAGALPVRLGPHVLRADTASAVAVAWMNQTHERVG